MYSFGDKLKKLRNEKKLSQGQLADELNAKFGSSVNKSMISKWENDKEEPRMESIRNIVSFFNITLDYLIDNNTNDNKSEANIIDIAKDMESFLRTLENENNVIKFNGAPLNDDVKSTLKVSIENLMLLTEQLSKK